MSTDIIGFIGALSILASFALRGEKKIRLTSLVGYVFLAWYGFKCNPHNFILIFLGVAAVLINCVQFWNMWKESRSAKAVAKAEARAAEAEEKLKKDNDNVTKNDIPD